MLLVATGRGLAQDPSSNIGPAGERVISIFFGGGSYYVTPEQRERLRTFIDAIPDADTYGIEIHGRTDDIGDRSYNLRLSDFRTRAVEELLLLYPLPPEIMERLPLGEDNPSFDNATWDGKLSNRRVDVVFKPVVM